ncbi:MAG: diacylglycerol kinase family protein [Thermoflexales bacterium]
MGKLLRAFQFAFEGIGYALRTQRNMRIHLAVALMVVVVGAALRLSATEWAILALTIGLVMQAELLNTALEALVDHVAPTFQPLAKVAKDCSAGAVLIVALAAAAAGVCIFVPRLWALWQAGTRIYHPAP